MVMLVNMSKGITWNGSRTSRILYLHHLNKLRDFSIQIFPPEVTSGLRMRNNDFRARFPALFIRLVVLRERGRHYGGTQRNQLPSANQGARLREGS